MDISFVILNYKTKGLLKNCIRSLKEAEWGDFNYEIIVVDNNSKDGIKKMLQDNFTNIIFVQSQRNLGMGAGNNLGIKQAKGKYIAVLNPDTMANKDSFTKLFQFMEEQPRVGLAGPKLINPDGQVQYTRCRFPSFVIPVYRRTLLQKLPSVKRKLEQYLTKDSDYDTAQSTDWLYGACLFIRKTVLDEIGLFDERFFLGFEDTDLCRRVWEAGYEVWYYPTSTLIHYPHRFSGNTNWLTGIFNRRVRIHIQSWLKYFWKYRRKTFNPT